MGHNSYGEIAWPNDLLYMFPVCILGVLGLSTSLAYLAPTEVGETSDPFSTPRHLRFYPEWFFFFPNFRDSPRAVPEQGGRHNLAMAAVPVGLAVIPVAETINPFSQIPNASSYIQLSLRSGNCCRNVVGLPIIMPSVGVVTGLSAGIATRVMCFVGSG